MAIDYRKTLPSSAILVLAIAAILPASLLRADSESSRGGLSELHKLRQEAMARKSQFQSAKIFLSSSPKAKKTGFQKETLILIEKRIKKENAQLKHLDDLERLIHLTARRNRAGLRLLTNIGAEPVLESYTFGEAALFFDNTNRVVAALQNYRSALLKKVDPKKQQKQSKPNETLIAAYKKSGTSTGASLYAVYFRGTRAESFAEAVPALIKKRKDAIRKRNSFDYGFALSEGWKAVYIGRENVRRAENQLESMTVRLDRRLKNVEAVAKRKKQSLEQFLRTWQTSVRRNGLPKAYIALLKKNGLNDDAVARHRKRMLSYDPAKTIETYRKFRLSRVGAGKSKNRPVEDVQWTLVGLPWLVKWRDFQKTRIVLSPTRDWRPRGHALQATGKPDTPGNLKGAGQGVVKTAWAAKTPNAGREWLQLSFPETVTAKSLSVVEAGVSGAVTSVICFTNGGKPQVVWQRKKNAKGPSLLPRQIVLETPVKTDRVKILLDTALVRGFNQIDAVELTDVTGKKSYALSAEASSNHYSGTWRWKVVPAGTLVTNLFKAPLFESAESQPLLSGRYDVYLCPRGEEGEKVIPHAYCIVRGLRVNSGYRSHANFEGIALRTDEQIGSVHSWFAIQSGSSAITTIEPQPGDTSMPLWVRPGRYDVYCRLHKYGSARLLKRGVEVSRFQLSKVDLNSGIRLEVGKFAPARDKRYGCWGIVPKGEVPDRESKLLNMTRTDSSLLVPPGLYDIYWKQGYYYSPSLIASGIRVGTSLRKVTVHSGIRLKGPDTLFKVNKSYGFWGVVPAGADPKNPSHKSIGAKESHLLVPPGKYDIVWKKEYRSAVKVLKKSVVVESDKLLILEIQ